MNGAELAHRFFDAIQTRDRATIERMCTTDAVVWHNYDGIDRPFAVVAEGLHRLPALLKEFVYADRRYLPVPNGAVLQHSLTGTLPDRTRLNVPMMVRIYIRDGHISRFEEYVDHVGFAPLVQAMSEGTN